MKVFPSRTAGGRPTRWQRGNLIAELAFALGILGLVLVPLSLSFYGEQRLARAYVHRAIAIEIVDGEIEVLRAGAWRVYAAGQHRYVPRAESIAALPPGRFELTLTNARLRLEWIPERGRQGGRVTREVTLP